MGEHSRRGGLVARAGPAKKHIERRDEIGGRAGWSAVALAVSAGCDRGGVRLLRPQQFDFSPLATILTCTTFYGNERALESAAKQMNYIPPASCDACLHKP